MISIKNVSMRFPIPRSLREVMFKPLAQRVTYNTALSDVSLHFDQGDRIALLGPNGAGKTTLLKLIGGLFLPAVGEILINNLSTLHHNTAARRSVGFVMNEERSFFWRLTGRQNLMFFGALDNIFGKQLKKRVEEVIEMVGLAPFVDRPFSNYSSGMKQRLAMARGLLPDPDVLILDEPTRTLDPIACEELIELILRRIHTDSGKTLLIATHRFDEARRLCDKVMVINQGRIVSLDKLSDLTARDVDLANYYKNSLKGREPVCV